MKRYKGKVNGRRLVVEVTIGQPVNGRRAVRLAFLPDDGDSSSDWLAHLKPPQDTDESAYKHGHDFCISIGLEPYES